MTIKKLRNWLIAPILLPLGGCGMVVLDPAGTIAVQQRDIFLISGALMLLIIVPVMVLTVWFAWKYRHTNKDAHYDPEWHHSTRLEVVIWSAPLLIIIALGAVTWVGTHTLDPYRPLVSGRAQGAASAVSSRQASTDTAHQVVNANPAASKSSASTAATATGKTPAAASPAADAGGEKPLRVDVVAMQWKWLFIYPDLGIASINQLYAPIDRPISFRITSSDVMNSFYIPALAGQIYAMAGMQTQLHAAINKVGVYKGISANYSGAGFSWMDFKFHGVSKDDFDAWVGKVKKADGNLDAQEYLKLAKPSRQVPVHYYAHVDPHLFAAIVNLCVDTSKVCMSQMSQADLHKGAAKQGASPASEQPQKAE